MGYSEIIDKTVEVFLNQYGKIVVQLPNETLEFDKNNNTWTFNDVINAQNGNGIWIGGTVRNFNIINNEVIKANGNGDNSGNGISISGAEITFLTNNGVISGNGSENISSNGIYNEGTIETLTNSGIITGNGNGKYSGNGIYSRGKIITLINSGVITGNTSGSKEYSGNGVLNLEKAIETLENNGVILGNGKGDFLGNGILNVSGGTIGILTNHGVVLGDGNGADSSNGIYNYFSTITTLENTGVILGNRNENGNKSNNGIFNFSGTISTLTNTGIVLGGGNGDYTGNGISNVDGTIKETLTNTGVVLGNGNGDFSGNGIYNYRGEVLTLINTGIIVGNGKNYTSGYGIFNEGAIENLTNTGIIAGSNEAINNAYGTITNQENYGLLIDGAGTENQKITARTGGKIENSQSEYDGYTVMNSKITVDEKNTENILTSSIGKNADKHIFNLVDSSFITDKDFTLTNGIINSYQSQKDRATVQITGETVFKTENVTFNSVNSAIEKDNSPVVVMGDGENNTCSCREISDKR